MKILKTIPVTLHEKTVVDKVLCDVCNKNIENEGFDSSEVTIEGAIGSCYPESDSRTLYIADVCPDCFVEKVIPTLRQYLGIQFREIDNDDRYRKFE